VSAAASLIPLRICDKKVGTCPRWNGSSDQASSRTTVSSFTSWCVVSTACPHTTIKWFRANQGLVPGGSASRLKSGGGRRIASAPHPEMLSRLTMSAAKTTAATTSCVRHVRARPPDRWS